MSLRIIPCGSGSHQIAHGPWQRKNVVVVHPVSGLNGSFSTYMGFSDLGDDGQGRQRGCSGTAGSCTTSGVTRQQAWKSKGRLGIRSQLRGSGGSNLTMDDWKRKLPAKRKALYSHSLPCIEAWLQSLGFAQGVEDRALWNIERPDWHAQLSLDVTELHIRYLRKGPGKLDRDVERKFSYALSREDLENAILGGP